MNSKKKAKSRMIQNVTKITLGKKVADKMKDKNKDNSFEEENKLDFEEWEEEELSKKEIEEKKEEQKIWKKIGESIQVEIFTLKLQNNWILMLSCGMANHTWSTSWLSCLLTTSKRRCYLQQTSLPKKMDLKNCSCMKSLFMFWGSCTRGRWLNVECIRRLWQKDPFLDCVSAR